MTPINAELVVGASHLQAEAGREPLPVTNPANQEIIGYAPIADPRLVDEAVTQAAEAFPTWSTTPAPQRSSRLFVIASWIRANRDRLASTGHHGARGALADDRQQGHSHGQGGSRRSQAVVPQRRAVVQFGERVNVNNVGGGEVAFPYSGWKQSGLGVELSHQGLEEYLNTKHVRIETGYS